MTESLLQREFLSSSTVVRQTEERKLSRLTVSPRSIRSHCAIWIPAGEFRAVRMRNFDCGRSSPKSLSNLQVLWQLTMCLESSHWRRASYQGILDWEYQARFVPTEGSLSPSSSEAAGRLSS